MNQDLYTKIYIRASESGDKELIDFLELISVAEKDHQEKIAILEKDLRCANTDFEELEMAFQKMEKAEPEEARDIYKKYYKEL